MAIHCRLPQIRLIQRPLLSDTFVRAGTDGKLLAKEQLLTALKQHRYASVNCEDVRLGVWHGGASES